MTRLQKLLGALGWIVLAAVLLQLYFVARIGVMRLVDPQSTAFQRSEIAKLAVS